MSHPAVLLAIAVAASAKVIPPRLLIAGIIACVVPDANVLSLKFGIANVHDLGHRGLTHSLLFAITLGTLAAWAARALHTSRLTAFVFITLAAASHGLLDMLTNGGSSIAPFWPFSSERYFFPWSLIEISPLGIRRFLTARGTEVFASELVWVWAPCALAACAGRGLIKRKSSQMSSS
jgi:inner membrane protein